MYHAVFDAIAAAAAAAASTAAPGMALDVCTTVDMLKFVL